MAARPRPQAFQAAEATREATEGQNRTGYLWAKRVIDVVLSSAALVVLSPILLAAAVAIKLDSSGPVIFKHERMGYDWRRRQSKTFKMHKGRGQVGVDEMVQMDLEYIERRSIWIDIKILLKTIPVVLSGRGAA
jgi:lipopolysaccharide/colanic/teichoic acid biosynthesis glycosyltransferase